MPNYQITPDLAGSSEGSFANLIAASDPKVTTLGALVLDLLRERDGPLAVQVAFDDLYVSAGAAVSFQALNDVIFMTMDEVGKSSSPFSQDPGMNADPQLIAIINSVINPVKPARTVGSLVNAIEAALKGTTLEGGCKIVVDQPNSRIIVSANAAAMSVPNPVAGFYAVAQATATSSRPFGE